MIISDVDHIVITTGNLEACLHFYRDILGMWAVENEGRYSLHFGRHKFNIHTRPAEFLPAAEHPAPGTLDLCLVIEDDLAKVLGELKQKDAPLVTEIVERNGARGKMRSIYLRDPDGNLVELCKYD